MPYEYWFQGTPYALDPNSDSFYTGTNLPAASIGFPTSTQTANQVSEVTKALSSGTKAVEFSALSPDVFEMVPKQHLKEVNRLSKLTNTDISVHGPVIEPSGFTQQGWSEQNRELNERQLTDTVIRAHEISPDKPTPVTIHASVIPGTEEMPIDVIGKENLTPDELAIYEEKGSIPTTMMAVNQDTGQIRPLVREEMYAPEAGLKPEVWDPQRRLKSLNYTNWSQQISQMALYKKEADDILERAEILSHQAKTGRDPLTGRQLSEQEIQNANQQAFIQQQKATSFFRDLSSTFRNIYEQAIKYGDPASKEVLAKISQRWQKATEEPTDQSQLLDESLVAIQSINTPQLYKPVEEFAVDKASETFANVAFNAYDKFGEKAPIVSIENPPYGQALARGEELKSLIKEARDKFVERAKKKGMAEEDAKRAAASMIGATWDTSHISMMRKQGFKKEELVEEAKKIAPYVKHVHLNDNFGYTHTDLPPGMGDVPMKKILKELEKKGYKGKHIFEGANFFQHFKTAPHAMVLEAVGSPIYGMKAAPTWTQVYGTTGSYSGTYGAFLPEQHFSTYGAGFAGLPAELGGAVPGKSSRMSGTPMT